MIDETITEEWIKKAEKEGACAKALEWLREQPRTYSELMDYNIWWAVWAVSNLDIPIDYNRYPPFTRKYIMANRQDAPIDPSVLESHTDLLYIKQYRDDIEQHLLYISGLTLSD